MDAAGLGLMIGTRKRQRRHGGDLRLCNAPAHVTRLLRLTGLSPVFPDAEMRCADPGLSLVDLRDDVTTLHTSL
jgi:STAS domain